MTKDDDDDDDDNDPASYCASLIGSLATATSVNFRAMNLRTSSIIITGKDIFRTAIHSSNVSGVIWKTAERKSTSSIMKWRDIESAMAPISHLLHHGGISDSD